MIDLVYSTPWSTRTVKTEGQQELGTTQEWRAKVVEARQQAGMTQRELATRVGTSQNMISLIESGEVSSSGFVLAICRVLKIAPPTFHEDEALKEWDEIGHLMAHRSERKFRLMLSMARELAAENEDDSK